MKPPKIGSFVNNRIICKCRYTFLIEMINAYNLNGPGIGITVSCQKPCTVLTGLRWKENLASIHDSIVFIDEGDRFTLSEEFASAIKDTDNYYVIATRSSLFNLPYSINEIYGIRNVAGNKYQGTKRLYAEFYPMCRVGESESGGKLSEVRKVYTK